MRLPGESEERNSGLSLKYMMIGVSLCLLLILGAVVVTNNENKARKRETAEKEAAVLALEHEEAQNNAAADGSVENGSGMAGDAGTAGEAAQTAEEPMVSNFSGRKSIKDIERLYKENRLTAADFDFWDMYPDNEPEPVKTSESEERKKEDEDQTNNKLSRYDEAAQKEMEEDPAKDGKHTLITYADGSEEWVLINPYLERNTYDFTKLTMKADKMAYYEDGKKTSYIGADISKYNGETDFGLLRDAGIDYVMLRLGARGYGSGQIMLDEKYVENMTKATEAGIDIGVYFFSQAITAEEAVEEANFVIQNLANYQITYPVAFDMEYVENDKARIEALSREEKTVIAKAFLDTIKNAGYKTMIYGTKEWLMKQVDLTKLTNYDIWLSQQKDVPDYPYKFQMWQYTLKGDVSGIDGDVDLNISFVDYAEK